jgi:dipeptidyl aminopeptidase/acylaminoacyl peptidase
MRSAPLMAPRLRRGVGDPDADGDFLWSRSPLSRASRARSPILIAHGANDPRVPLSEAEQFVAALRQRGTPHRLLVYPGEGHGLVAPRNRLAFFGEAERFLAEHLGGRHE